MVSPVGANQFLHAKSNPLGYESTPYHLWNYPSPYPCVRHRYRKLTVLMIAWSVG